MNNQYSKNTNIKNKKNKGKRHYILSVCVSVPSINILQWGFLGWDNVRPYLIYSQKMFTPRSIHNTHTDTQAASTQWIHTHTHTYKEDIFYTFAYRHFRKWRGMRWYFPSVWSFLLWLGLFLVKTVESLVETCLGSDIDELITELIRE